jgi:hypothetical protein
MIPKFADVQAWQQAELLMQPVFIRVIDNLRKELERSPWKGQYRDAPVWTEDVPAELKTRIIQLQQELKTASPDRQSEIEGALAHLPQPHTGYELCLQHHDHEIVLDLWQLCYQICFRNYNPILNIGREPTVEIDTSLIDEETGDVDWNRIDDKAHQLIAQIFASLPSDKLQP